MRLTYLFLFFFLLSTFTQGQQLSPYSINNGGNQKNNYSQGFGKIHYSIGTPYVGKTNVAGRYQITSGYPSHLINPISYEIDTIPDQQVSEAGEIEFYIHSKLGAKAELAMIVNDPVYGDIYFSAFTGYFSYDPHEADNRPFEVKFLASFEGQKQSKTIIITPEKVITPVKGDFFGITEGDFNVSETGVVNYSIPIVVSPGTAGMEPKLSLEYSGGSGNGVLGLGWTLGGLSTISRSPHTYAQDIKIDPVDFDDDDDGMGDRLNIDGQRLMSITGSYGEEGTQYYTETNSFQRVTSFRDNGVTSKFIVETKSGLIKEYGFTEDSRIQAGQGWNNRKVMFWAVNKITDLSGNFMEFKYEEDENKEYRPIEISYTGNTKTGLVPYNKIVFKYEDRPDTSQIYVHGYILKKTKRLKQIICYYGEEDIAHEYNVTYADGIYSKITKIEEFGRGGSASGNDLAPVNFDWKANTLFNLKKYESRLPPFALITEKESEQQVIPGDWNRDGYTDFLVYDKSTGYNMWALNKGDITFYTYDNLIEPSKITGGEGLFFGDWDGNGIIDLMWWDKNDGTNKWFKTSIDAQGELSFSESTNQIVAKSEMENGTDLYTGDYNGDGLTEFFIFERSTGTIRMFINLFLPGSNKLQMSDEKRNIFEGNNKSLLKDTELYIGDWNADGLTDIMGWGRTTTGETSWLLNSGNTQEKEVSFKNAVNPIKLLINGNLFFGDWNADGITDLLWYDQFTGENHWYINKGNYDFETVKRNVIPTDELRFNKDNPINLQLNDFNADGFTDVMVTNTKTGSVKFFTNKGKLFKDNTNHNISNLKFKKNTKLIKIQIGIDRIEEKEVEIENRLRFLTGDWLGTGHAGIMWYNEETGENKWFVNEVSRNTQLQSIIESSRTYNIQYESILNKEVYKKGNDGAYPNIDFISPMQVVSKYEINNGLDGFNKFSFFYEGGKFSKQGRGFLGYTRVSKHDLQTGITNVNEFERDIKYAGASLKKSYTLTSIGDSLMVNEFTQGYQGIRTYFSYTPKHTKRKYELNGSLISNTVTHKDYDIYGNLTQSIINYQDGYVDTLTNTYYNEINDGKWLLGRLTESIISRTVPNQRTDVQSSFFEYDLESGMLIVEISHPNNDSLMLTKTYGYDDYGNIITSALKGNNGVKQEERTTLTRYDDKGRFIVSVSNALGHEEIRIYDPILGLLKEVTDRNSQKAYYEQDPLGRTVSVLYSDDTQSKSWYRWAKDLEEDYNLPENAFYAIVKRDFDTHGYKNAPNQIIWYDKVGRVVRTETEGFDGKVIYVDKTYNIVGDLVQTSDPYFSNDDPKLNLFKYDIYSRPIEQIEPGNRTSIIAYNGYTTTTTNTLGQKQILTKDPLGRVISSEDNIGNVVKYEYSSSGRLLKSIDPKGNVVEMQYDISGNRIKLIDPDLGAIKSTYNAFGELIKEVDALGQESIFKYDVLGRLVERIELEGETFWEYDSRPNGIGQLAEIKAPSNFVKTLTYDKKGRPVSYSEKINDKTYFVSNAYNDAGKIESKTYPSGFSISYDYNDVGLLHEITRKSNGFLYWQAEQYNAKMQLERSRRGNGLSTIKRYDEYTSYLANIETTNGETTIQNLNFVFDNIGNLLERSDGQRELIEKFTYDELNRLVTTNVFGGQETTIQYDEIGNITYKSDVGTYVYGENGAPPHAVTSINDLNVKNKMVMANLSGTIEYTSYKKAKSIKADNNKVEIEYGYNRARDLIHLFKNDTLLSTKVYVDNFYEEEQVGDTINRIHYIFANGEVIASYVKNNFDTDKTEYFHRDHLGSIQSITNEDGNLVNAFSYDAWGKRRDGETWGNLVNDNNYHRGFTGHEHLDLVSLIHMNGRVYDPAIGRFTSPDPFIQNPLNLQSLNRYSYVLNNPLSFVDPSGFLTIKWNPSEDLSNFANNIGREADHFYSKNRQTINAIAVTTLSIYTGGLVGGFYGAAVGGFVSGAASAKLAGASDSQAFQMGIKKGVISGISAGLSYGVGEAYGHSTSAANVVEKSIAHGVVQGAVSEAQGGKFEHGFITGAVTSATHMEIFSTGDDVLLDVLKSAVVGGTTAELVGGNFQQGAEQAAIITLYNKSAKKWLTSKQEKMTKNTTSLTAKKFEIITGIAGKEGISKRIGIAGTAADIALDLSQNNYDGVATTVLQESIKAVTGQVIGAGIVAAWPDNIATEPMYDPGHPDYIKNTMKQNLEIFNQINK